MLTEREWKTQMELFVDLGADLYRLDNVKMLRLHCVDLTRHHGEGDELNQNISSRLRFLLQNKKKFSIIYFCITG